MITNIGKYTLRRCLGINAYVGDVSEECRDIFGQSLRALKDDVVAHYNYDLAEIYRGSLYGLMTKQIENNPLTWYVTNKTFNGNTYTCCEGSGNYGFVFGSGNTPATAEDYWISGERVTSFDRTYITHTSYGENYIEVSVTHTLTNNATTAITIGEVALVDVFRIYSNSSTSPVWNPILLERTAFDTPITIEPGGVGQVTHTIRVYNPTA